MGPMVAAGGARREDAARNGGVTGAVTPMGTPRPHARRTPDPPSAQPPVRATARRASEQPHTSHLPPARVRGTRPPGIRSRHATTQADTRRRATPTSRHPDS
ncbi:hypothetical protein GCM10009601_03350 [Streptomyces thermospinosisporus]|uniref:Uncharacterized protein n=1 Tax=Streptomyces thermospinosisporus TaxID=161482 RepID=A0ABN1YII3_9ACTN